MKTSWTLRKIAVAISSGRSWVPLRSALAIAPRPLKVWPQANQSEGVMALPDDDFPLDADGLPFANYVQVPPAARPRFGHGFGTAPAVGGKPAIVVIGAGYTGLSAALHLAELRHAAGSDIPILLLDADYIGSGPSGKSGGHVCGLHARDDAVLRHCGRELGERLIAGVAEGIGLVRSLIGQHGIPCDLCEGYVEIGPEGKQTLVDDGSLYGIDPYPFVVGLAKAAVRLGVRIHEGLRVTGIKEDRATAASSHRAASSWRGSCLRPPVTR
jgi:hypothetical protein